MQINLYYRVTERGNEFICAYHPTDGKQREWFAADGVVSLTTDNIFTSFSLESFETVNRYSMLAYCKITIGELEIHRVPIKTRYLPNLFGHVASIENNIMSVPTGLSLINIGLKMEINLVATNSNNYVEYLKKYNIQYSKTISLKDIKSGHIYKNKKGGYFLCVNDSIYSSRINESCLSTSRGNGFIWLKVQDGEQSKSATKVSKNRLFIQLRGISNTGDNVVAKAQETIDKITEYSEQEADLPIGQNVRGSDCQYLCSSFICASPTDFISSVGEVEVDFSVIKRFSEKVLESHSLISNRWDYNRMAETHLLIVNGTPTSKEFTNEKFITKTNEFLLSKKRTV